MTRTELRTYTPEFRAEAVKLVLEQGLSLEAAGLCRISGCKTKWYWASPATFYARRNCPANA